MLMASYARSGRPACFKFFFALFCVTALAITAVAQNYSPLVSFTGANGANPAYESLTLGTDGKLYGTTSAGGAHGFGTVFQMTTNGTLTSLYSFTNGSDGEIPYSGLVQGADGNFYGTTLAGGANSFGTIFKITPSGTLTTVYAFDGTHGATPQSAMILGTDGNFYGTTGRGGVSSVGTVFKLTPGGTLTTLHSFGGSDGTVPLAGLVQASDGNFYGTAATGGDSNAGTVFMITPGGSFTRLHSFAGTDGAQPYGPLVQASDGNLYGTTSARGANSFGTVFKITTGGTFTSLHDLTLSDGAAPFGGLIQAADGNLYGTTSEGGTGGDSGGTVFKITPGGTLTPIYSFRDAGSAFGGLIQINGVFYGTTFRGGTGMGVVYSLTTGQFLIPVSPCRLVDTRNPNGPFGGPAITGGTARSFVLPQNPNCNIPSTAAAYSLNVTVVPHSALRFLTIWPTGQDQPTVSTLNSPDGRTKANAAIVPAGVDGAVSVYVTDTSDVILDIDGYFALTGSPTLQFYPVTPCRVVDTRDGQQPQGLGPPALSAMQQRELPILTSPCVQGLPHQAEAYSFNVTVVPNPVGQRLGYLTIWPSDQQQPLVSTLNNPTATAVANGAIVPAAANGDVSVFGSQSTDLVIDINGYFAAPAQDGFYFFRLTPCRAYDSRDRDGQFQGERTLNIVGSLCAPPSAARAYVLNATVVPNDFLGYLTLWPDGSQQPLVSTLNARDGLTTSNLAIVPNMNGSIDAYASQLTSLILDISGYFGP
jgi:uncharacterized repeat protein (TIGR03803 family)